MYGLVAEDCNVDSSYEYEQKIAAINGTGKYVCVADICNKFAKFILVSRTPQFLEICN